MAITEHKGSGLYNGDIVVYSGSFGTNYGYELLKSVWVTEAESYMWVVRGLKILDGQNKVTYLSSDKTSLDLLTTKDVEDSYPLKWTKDPEFKKGDILIGKDTKANKTMLFVYLADDHVERLTPRSDMLGDDQFGYSTLSDYAGNFGPLKVHTTQGYTQAGNNTKFSAL